MLLILLGGCCDMFLISPTVQSEMRIWSAAAAVLAVVVAFLYLSRSSEPTLTVGGVFYRNESDPDYLSALRASLWNARLPTGFPAVIYQANNISDVLDAVKLANSKNYPITVCSGKHSFAGNHIREGALLLDVSRLREVSIDKNAMRATAGPGVKGTKLAVALYELGLHFPYGHCDGPALGGYILQGGFGYDSMRLGVGAQSLIAIDVVTADGVLRHCNASNECSDLLWAARGSGCSFFAVVVRFHLRLYPLPAVVGSKTEFYSMELKDEVYKWAHSVAPTVSTRVEFQLLISNGKWPFPPHIIMVAIVFADSMEQKNEVLAFLENKPFSSRPGHWFDIISLPFMQMSTAYMAGLVSKTYPDHHRYGVDNFWTHASAEQLSPYLSLAASGLPDPKGGHSHVLWLNWMPRRATQAASDAERKKQDPDFAVAADMAFSVDDDFYVAMYGVWRDEADDAKYGSWAFDVAAKARADGIETGIQLADENLRARNGRARALAPAKADLVERIRNVFDPSRRFVSCLA